MKLKLYLLSLVFVNSETSDSLVVDLTDATFDEFVKVHHVMVKFYAPWCGHCKALKGTWDDLATFVSKDESMNEVKVAKVDCTVHSQVCKTHSISGYPTLKFFKTGSEHPQDYDGGRDIDSLSSYLTRVTGPPVRRAILDAEIKKPTLRIRRKNFTEEHVKFANKFFSDVIVEHEESEDEETVLLHVQQSPVKFEGSEETSETLEAFFTKNEFPMWGQLDGTSFQKYHASNRAVVWFLFLQSSADELFDIVATHTEAVQKMAQEFSDVAFTYTCTQQYGKVIEHLLAVKEFPAIVYQENLESRKKYHLTEPVFVDGKLNTDAIVAFLKKAAAGQLSAVLASEPVPENQDEPVYTVVGSTLTSVMMDPERDVLLEIYAPWCTHCKTFEPQYKEIAEQVQRIGAGGMLRLAKMDGTQNDSPIDAIKWDQGFPTLYYTRANSTEMIPITDRSPEALWTFMLENHSQKEVLSRLYKAEKQTTEEETTNKDTKDEKREEL